MLFSLSLSFFKPPCHYALLEIRWTRLNASAQKQIKASAQRWRENNGVGKWRQFRRQFHGLYGVIIAERMERPNLKIKKKNRKKTEKKKNIEISPECQRVSTIDSFLFLRRWSRKTRYYTFTRARRVFVCYAFPAKIVRVHGVISTWRASLAEKIGNKNFRVRYGRVRSPPAIYFSHSDLGARAWR